MKTKPTEYATAPGSSDTLPKAEALSVLQQFNDDIHHGVALSTAYVAATARLNGWTVEIPADASEAAQSAFVAEAAAFTDSSAEPAAA